MATVTGYPGSFQKMGLEVFENYVCDGQMELMQMNHLYPMDNMDGMRQFPDKYFELAIIDPPYGIHQSGGKNKTRNKATECKNYKDFYGEDKEPPKKEFFDELMRVSKNQIIFGANHFISRIPYDSSCWIVWDKDNTGNFADCELAWTSFKGAVRKFRYRWNGMIQEHMDDKEFRIHPTQKPVALYDWILTNFAKPGDKILDTHAGSCSSLIACHRKGFEFIGFEIDEHYYPVGNKRLQAELAQGNLFADYSLGYTE